MTGICKTLTVICIKVLRCQSICWHILGSAELLESVDFPASLGRMIMASIASSQPTVIQSGMFPWNMFHYMWPSATKWGSLRGLTKSRMIIHCNKHNFLHILMQKWLFYDIHIKSYSMLNIVMHDIIENIFIEIWAQKDCNLCITLWASQKANVP